MKMTGRDEGRWKHRINEEDEEDEMRMGKKTRI
jgi:hypothetical protein